MRTLFTTDQIFHDRIQPLSSMSPLDEHHSARVLDLFRLPSIESSF